MAKELLDLSSIVDISKCDVFSLGITVFEIITNVGVPMNGERWHELREARLLPITSTALDSSSPSKPPKEDITLLPQTLEILTAMMLRDPASRISADDALARLDAWVAASSVTSASSTSSMVQDDSS